LHSSSKKAPHSGRLSLLWPLLLALVGACQPAPEATTEVEETAVTVATSCGDKGYLSTQLYGGIAREISWNAGELSCESMIRPDGRGMRLRITGDVAGNQLAIILALPELQRGSTGTESPTVVTLTVEGSGRFFSTPTLEACWSDIAAQDSIGDGDDRFDISGVLYCVAPLGEINGDAAISIPRLEFRGIIDWSTT